MRKCTILKCLIAALLLGVMPGMYAADDGGRKLLMENFETTGLLATPLGGAEDPYMLAPQRWLTFGSGTNTMEITASALSYEGYGDFVNSVNLKEGTANGLNAARFFTPTKGTVYASMLLKVTKAPLSTITSPATGDYVFTFLDASSSYAVPTMSNAICGKLFVKGSASDPTKFAFGIARVTTNNAKCDTYTEETYECGKTYLVVLKYIQNSAQSKVELFVNPDLQAEPTPVLTNQTNTATDRLLNYAAFNRSSVNNKYGTDIQVGALRVATSWNALFDNSAVSPLTQYNSGYMSYFAGDMKQGDNPKKISLGPIRFIGFSEEVAVTCDQSDYINFDGTGSTTSFTIDKFVSKYGVYPACYLAPKDGKVTSANLIFTSGNYRDTILIKWNYLGEPVDAKDIAEFKTLSSVNAGIYKLTGAVKVTQVTTDGVGILTFTLEDATGSFTVTDSNNEFQRDSEPYDNTVYTGCVLTNLKVVYKLDNKGGSYVCNVSELDKDYTFEAPTQNGVKLLTDNFDEKTAGDLAGQDGWKSYESGLAGGDPVQLVSGALSMQYYSEAKDGKMVNLVADGEDIEAPFQVIQSGDVYASMLVNVKEASEAGNYIFGFGTPDKTLSSEGYDQSAHYGYGKLYIKDVKGGLSFGINGSGMEETQYTAPDYKFDRTYLIVVKYSQRGGMNDYAELFVIDGNNNYNNTLIRGSLEPRSTLKSQNVMMAPFNGIGFANLYQYRPEDSKGQPDAKADYTVSVDAVRVANSWGALFDDKDVAKASALTVTDPANPGMPATSLTFGEEMLQGSPAEERTINIKAKDLQSDLTLKSEKEGYISFVKTITKAEAEAEKGYDLKIKLDPKDSYILSDVITITGNFVKMEFPVSWNFMMKADMQDVKTLSEVKGPGYYTLTGKVKVSKITEEYEGSYIYTLADKSGSLDVRFVESVTPEPMAEALTIKDLEEGETYINICVAATQSQIGDFVPAFELKDSPELQLTEEEMEGIKVFGDNFDYATGSILKGQGDWEFYSVYSQTEGASGDPIKVIDESLTYAKYQDNPVGKAVQLKSKGESVASEVQIMKTGTTYASMLVNVKEAPEEGNYIFGFGTPYNTTQPQDPYNSFGRLFVKKTVDGKLAFGVSQARIDADAVVYSAATYEFDKTYLVVVKYNQVPSYNNDVAEIFINPDFSGQEPSSTVRSTVVGSEPSNKGIGFVNLFQYNTGVSATKTEYNVTLDALRVATSWESLFDSTPPGPIPTYELTKGGATLYELNLGTAVQGQASVETTINIKAKNLKEDLTVSCKTKGYLSFEKTISMEDAMSETGYDLKITLTPKDALASSDMLKITSKFLKVQLPVKWNYIAKEDKKNVSELRTVKLAGYYTLTNDVLVTNIATGSGMGNAYQVYTLVDGSGSIDVNLYDASGSPKTAAETRGINADMTDVKKGDRLKNLCIFVTGNELTSFQVYDSPNLVVTTPIKAEKNTLAEIKDAKVSGYFTLVNKVNVKEIKNATDYNVYSLEDASGTLDVKLAVTAKTTEDIETAITIDKVVKGQDIKNLCVFVTGYDFTTYEVYKSPKLVVVTSGIDDISNGTITGYVNGQFIAEGASGIKVYDANGRRLAEVSGESIDINNVSGSVLFIQYNDATGNAHTVKIVK